MKNNKPKHYQNITKERQQEMENISNEQLEKELFGDFPINSIRNSLLLCEWLYRKENKEGESNR